MKNFKSYISAVAIGAMVLTSVSCQKSFYTKANNNPNAPKSVPNGTLLSGIEVTLGYIEGGDYSRFACMFTQQICGYSRQSAAYYQYIFTNQDPETAWDNIYDDVLANSYQLMQQAEKGGNHEYYGIGEIMMAYGVMRTVDMWGNIPYSQAFRGVSSPTPSFDVDKSLYDTVRALCYRGITNMNPTLDATDLYSPDQSNANGNYDGLGSDVMYQGNATQWVKFAHAILARLFIHQTKHSNAAMCDSALAHVALSFTSNADNAKVTFGTAANNNAPWFQFDQQRGDICMYENWFTGAGLTTWADSLSRENDPRLILQIDSTAEITGQDVALDGIYTGYGYFGQGNSPVEFIDYAELQFIAAEATIRTAGVTAAAQTYYSNGIQADMSKLGVAPATITAFMLGSQGNILTLTTAQAIVQNAWQENIALYLNPESWTLWRRCNWNITPVSGTAVPRRFLYPQSELNLNTANVPAATQYSPVVFWDN